jgi:hypothetical protein
MNKGLSGSNIELIDDYTVRKKSNNPRLFYQCMKQIGYSEDKTYLNIKTPDVRDWSWNKDHTEFHFDMDYIPASSFKEYFLSANKSDLDNFYDDLDQYLYFIINFDEYPVQNYQVLIVQKLVALLDSDYKEFIQYLINTLQTKTVMLPYTPCHGDLTLSNILFKDGKHYFIDFLDSHIDTYYYDLSKLKQDLYYKWSLQVENIDSLKTEQCIDYLWKKLYHSYGDIFNSKEFQFIDALTLLRIEPYTKDNHTKIILKNCIEKLKLYEEFINTISR